jgi:hypothetical protein
MHAAAILILQRCCYPLYCVMLSNQVLLHLSRPC